MTNSYKLDDLDVKILKELFKDARAKVSDIAKTLKIPHATIYSRIKGMEDSKLIQGYVPVIRACDMGRPIKAIVEIKAIDAKKSDILFGEELKKLKDAVSCYNMTGNYDGIAIIVGKDIEDINRKVVSIRQMKSVKDTQTHIVLEVLKENDSSAVFD